MWVTDRTLTHPLPHSCCSSIRLAELLCGTANARFQRQVLCTVLLQKCVVFFSPLHQWEPSFQANAGNIPSKGGKSLASVTRALMQAAQTGVQHRVVGVLRAPCLPGLSWVMETGSCLSNSQQFFSTGTPQTCARNGSWSRRAVQAQTFLVALCPSQAAPFTVYLLETRARFQQNSPNIIETFCLSKKKSLPLFLAESPRSSVEGQDRQAAQCSLLFQWWSSAFPPYPSGFSLGLFKQQRKRNLKKSVQFEHSDN